MNKKKLTLLFLVVATFVVGKHLYDQKVLRDLNEARLKAQNSIESGPSDDEAQNGIDPDSVDQDENTLSPDLLKVTPPSQESLKKEVAKDPHNTPESLTLFSHQLGEKLRAAKSTSQKITLFIELESCALGENVDSAQALCLLNARKLSKLDKKLEGPYQTLSQKVSPAVLKRIENIP